MEKSNLIAKAHKVLVHYPNQEAVYVTSDGQCFFDRNAADSHQQRMGNRDEVLEVSRAITAADADTAPAVSGSKSNPAPEAHQAPEGDTAPADQLHADADKLAPLPEAPKKTTRTRTPKTT